MSTWHNVGRIAPVPKGTWSAAAVYSRLDLITDASSSKLYMAVKDVPAGIPLTNTEYWSVVLDNKFAVDKADEAVTTANRAESKIDQSFVDTVDRLTSPFDKSGRIVSCNPVERYPLKVKTLIEPAQSGSGDPYPAGGGKNLIPFPYIDASKNENGLMISTNDDGSISADGTPTARVLFTLAQNYVLQPGTYTLSGLDAASTGKIDLAIFDLDWNTLAFANNYDGKLQSTFVVTEAKTIKINIYFNENVNVKQALIRPQLEAGAFATEFAPYSNIRPISGHTGAKLTKCGKNLLVIPNVGGWTSNGVTWSSENGAVKAVGTANGDSYTNTYESNVPKGELTLPNGFYKTAGWTSKIQVIARVVKSGNVTQYPNGMVFTVDDNTESVRIFFYTKTGSVVDETFYPMLVRSEETDLTYEPYQGDTVTANFGQTVYGGTMDWNTGVLTVEWTAIDGGSRNWSAYTDGGVTVFLGDGNPAKSYGAFNIISSHYKTSKNMLVSQMGDMEIKGSQSSGAIFVRDTRYTDQTAFKAAMSGVQICYQLQNPITIQLTPAQITALQGMNNIWCDAGETTVSGRKDILWLIDYLIDRIKALETAIISTGGNV